MGAAVAAKPAVARQAPERFHDGHLFAVATV